MISSRIIFYSALFMLLGIDAFMVALITGSSIATLVLVATLAVPALFIGIDLWQLASSWLDRRSAWFCGGGEFAGIARLLLAWLLASLPVMGVLFALNALTIGQFNHFVRPEDAIRLAFGLSLWHAFLGLGYVSDGRRGIGIAGLLRWFEQSGAEDKIFSNSMSHR
jgi:hypothetical protein